MSNHQQGHSHQYRAGGLRRTGTQMGRSSRVTGLRPYTTQAAAIPTPMSC